MRRSLAAGLALVLGLSLAACVEEPPERPGPPGALMTEAGRAECTMRGGYVAHAGLAQDQHCFTNEPDAGKSCRKASDCSGYCLADTRTCSPVSPMFGCFEFLDADGRKVGLCID